MKALGKEAERSDLLIQMRNCILKRIVAREASGMIPWQWVSASRAAPGLQWRLTYETCKTHVHIRLRSSGRAKTKIVSLTALTQTSRANSMATRQSPRLPGRGLRIVNIPAYTTAWLHRHFGSIVAIVHCRRGKSGGRSNFDEPSLGSRAASPRQTC